MPTRSNAASLILLAGGFILAAIAGLWIFMGTTAAPLHPKPQEAPSVTHAAPPPEWTAAVDQARQLVRAHLTERNLPGLSVAVGIDVQIVWAEGFGFADLKTGTPVTPNHRFPIGTASTALTSAAAGLLLEKGKLKLDEAIQTYVPEFPQKKWPVTLRHLMGHLAGLHSDGGDEGTLFTQHCERPAESLKHFADSDLLSVPGTEYRYSNYGWIPVSAAIETAAGKPFLTYMREQFFEPLGMKNTIPDPGPVEPDDDHPLFNLFREQVHDPRTTRRKTPDAARNALPDRATSYFPRFMADTTYGLHLMRPLDLSCYAGASVFLSTPSDLVRFAMAVNGGKLLQPATVQLLQTSQRLASGKETGYGLGWDIETVNLAGKPTRAVGHDGDMLGGVAASLLMFPERGIFIAVLSNISYAETSQLAEKIAQTFADEPK